MANLVLGPIGGKGGHEFNGYAIPSGAKVHEIRVNAGSYVDGLQLVCVDAAGVVTELPHLGGKGGFHHTITLDVDEYLTGISGRSGRYVDSIRFHTNKRTTDSIGGRGGENEYHFEAAANGEVGGFFGRADWFIDQLGVILRDRLAGASAATVAQPSAEPVKAAKAKTTPAATPAAETPAAKPATKSRKKTAPVTDLVAIPESAPVTPPTPDLVAIPEAGPVTPPAPDLIGVPQSGPVDATAPELVGIPDSAPVEVESASMVAGTRTDSVDLAAASPADDLTKIEGIGPKIAQVLADAGITTYAALANTPAARLREILDAAGSRYRITDPTTWPEQAAFAASGDWAAFSELVARLKASKRA